MVVIRRGIVRVERNRPNRLSAASLHAVRENPERARFLGYDSSQVKVIVFGISAAVAALGGLAYSLYVQLASPDLVGFAFSTEVLIWVAIGGRGALVGAATGALLVNIGTEELSANLLGYWHLILGLASSRS